MRKCVFLAFFALLALVVRAQDESGDLVKEGQQMPAFTIVNDNGTQVPSSSLKGKVILVNFFATWCPPCQKELAEVQKTLWPKYKDNKKKSKPAFCKAKAKSSGALKAG
jgi:thiol-disulfide isomerase/thioredoxin